MRVAPSEGIEIHDPLIILRPNEDGPDVAIKIRIIIRIPLGLFPPQRQRFRLRWIRRDLAAGERRSAIHIRVIAEFPDAHVVKSFIYRDDVQNLRRVPRVTNDYPRRTSASGNKALRPTATR